MNEQIFDPDGFRPAEHVCEPDPRTLMFVRVDIEAGTSRPIELADQHEQISNFVLHAGVPQEIAVQFETARNIYLYAWFVYRFYPVAEHQSLACLELALRERLREEIRTGKFKEKRPTLRPLLRYAVEQDLIRNEGFSTWRNRGVVNSRHRVEMAKMHEAAEKNLETISWDGSAIEITEEDLDWDYVKMLTDVLPKLRNEYAHGTTNLQATALWFIQIASEIINQLFEVPDVTR
jgi:hypothetical protein